MPCSEMICVRPGIGVLVHSQHLMAKKNPTIAISLVVAKWESQESGNSAPDKLFMPRRSLGVIARWRLVERIFVGVGLHERTDDGLQGRRVRVVEGALFEIDPKRRTQEACGLPHSVCNHWLRTHSVRRTGGGPLEGT